MLNPLSWLFNSGSGQAGVPASGGLVGADWYSNNGFQAPSNVPYANLGLNQMDAFSNDAQFGMSSPVNMGQSGSNWWNPSNWTQGGVGMAKDLTGILGSGFGIFSNMRNYGLAKDAMKMQEKYAGANLYNQAASSNNALRERAMLTKARWGVSPKYEKAKSSV